MRSDNRIAPVARHALIPGVSILAVGLASATQADDDVGTLTPEKAERAFGNAPIYSPYAGRNFPTRPLFGDTHLHTGASFDAGAFGARLTPRDAYRFARGEELIASSGQPVKLSRPLDFLVVADHSDNMGMFPDLFAGKPEVLSDPQARTWYEMIKSGQGGQAALEIIFSFSDGTLPKSMIYGPDTRPYKLAWQDTIEAAEEYNEPGRFTAFIGYEWTSNTGGNNLHRNVIFRDGGDKAVEVVPYTTMAPLGSDNPRDLWAWMEAYEDKTGGNVLAIAHNGNLSNGRMFPLIESFTGQPLDAEYVENRARWSPSTKRRRPRAMARRTRFYRLMTSSRTSSAGISATSMLRCPRRRTCWSSSMRARPCAMA